MLRLWSQRRLLYWVEAKQVNVVEPVPTFVLGWRQKMQCSEPMPTFFIFVWSQKLQRCGADFILGWSQKL